MSPALETRHQHGRYVHSHPNDGSHRHLARWKPSRPVDCIHRDSRGRLHDHEHPHDHSHQREEHAHSHGSSIARFSARAKA